MKLYSALSVQRVLPLDADQAAEKRIERRTVREA
jgi:hypothetical protein